MKFIHGTSRLEPKFSPRESIFLKEHKIWLIFTNWNLSDSNNSSLSNSIENYSLMHQRKKKTFNDLYACYIWRILCLVFKKFPRQLDLDPMQKITIRFGFIFRKKHPLGLSGMIQKSASFFQISCSPCWWFDGFSVLNLKNVRFRWANSESSHHELWIWSKKYRLLKLNKLKISNYSLSELGTLA